MEKKFRSQTVEYTAWSTMLKRCYNETDPMYPRYGERGISVCDRWKNSFEYFLEDMGFRPFSDYSLDRINNDGNYCPENCRWTTDKEQCNNKSNNLRFVINEEEKTLKQRCEFYNKKYHTVWTRVTKGWDINKALFEPVSGDGRFKPNHPGGTSIKVKNNKTGVVFNSKKAAAAYEKISLTNFSEKLKRKIIDYSVVIDLEGIEKMKEYVKQQTVK